MTNHNDGGIDKSSTVDDVRDALSRMGATLETHQADGGWVGVIRPGDTRVQGSSEDEAGYEAWRHFLAVQGGTGSS